MPSPAARSRARSSGARGSARDGGEEPLEEPGDMRLVDPTHHGDQIGLGIDPDETAAGAARGPRARATDVEPPQESVLRVDRTRSPTFGGPAWRQNLRVAPATVAKMQQAEARVIGR